MSATVKSEPPDQNGVESMILNILQSKSDGLTNQDILTALPQLNTQLLLDALNNLFRKHAGNIQVGKLSNGELIYKLKTLTTSSGTLKGVDNEERLVYQIVEEAGRKGIWNKDIQEKCKINNKQLDKILKSLEGKKLVKKISSVASARKKIYMLFNLEPDESVTGGVFYSDQRFDSEYVDLINQCCLRILQQRAEASKDRDLDLMELKNSQFMSSEDILKTLTDSNVSKVRLTLSDIELIMQTLIYDGKVEKNVVIERHKSRTNLYRATTSFIKSSGLMHTPCGHCPVRTDCRPGNVISPEKCIYMSTWLDF